MASQADSDMRSPSDFVIVRANLSDRVGENGEPLWQRDWSETHDPQGLDFVIAEERARHGAR